jgi:hypothetical protein
MKKKKYMKIKKYRIKAELMLYADALPARCDRKDAFAFVIITSHEEKQPTA